jgi:hypothetical protein
MMEIISGVYEYIYTLRNEDKIVTYAISFKSYFELSKYYDVDEHIKDLLEREMKKINDYDSI